MEQSQAADAITQAIVVMSTENVPELVGLLKNSGSFVTQQSSQEQLLDAAFKALKNSSQFRKNLGAYLINVTNTDNGDYGNFVDTDFSNFVKYDPTVAGSGSRVGNLLRQIGTKENIDTLIKTGIGVGAAKLQESANKSSEQRAIDYQIATAKANEAQALINAQNPPAAKNKWILPVGIGLGGILVGTVIYFAVKKK